MSKTNPPTSVTAVPPRGRELDLRAESTRSAPLKPVPVSTKLTPYSFLKPIASLRLTVVLMLMSMFLVYAGTLAQVDRGIWQVVDEYFWSFFVWVPLKNLIPGFLFTTKPTYPTFFGFEIGVPFVGGKLLGFLLLINLVAAHATRFKVTWKRTGIWLIHLGLILLFIGEVVTRERAEEYRMPIEEGRSRNYIEDHRDVELAFVDLSDPQTDRVAVVPASRLKPGTKIVDPALPVDIEVLKFMANSATKKELPANAENLATKGIGLIRFAEENSVVSGTDTEQTVDMPSTYVRLIDRSSGQPVGVFLFSALLGEQRVDLGGKPFEIDLRFRRTYLPFTMHLSKFEHKVYEGTDKPRDFRSHITLNDSETGIERHVEIYMNTPLRYRGKTFYQSGFMDPKVQGMKGTILQVVDNPGWLIPYISCVMVSLGMLVHFGVNLIQFMSRQIKAQGGKS